MMTSLRRNVQDMMADEQRFGQVFEGPTIPLGASVEYLPITANEYIRTRAFVKKTLKVIFFGNVYITRGRIW